MELLYRVSRDGTTADVFHKKCDNKGLTICFYKNNKGNIFGGYSSISWTNSGNEKSAPDSFLFALTNIHGIKPLKFDNSKKKCGIYHHPREGPVFGANDIYIDQDYRYKCISHFPEYYTDFLDKGKSIFKDTKLNITKIEVFQVFK